MALRFTSRIIQPLRIAGVRCMTGDPGSGAGKGGGTGGSIRDAGGSFGKMEQAHEEQYFRRLEKEQFEEFRKHVKQQTDFHEDEIKSHQEAIDRHKRRIAQLETGGPKSGSDSD